MNKLIFVIFIIFFVGCKDYQQVVCTGVKGFNINKINQQGLDANVILGIKNPNQTSFSIYKSEFEIKYGGLNLGKAVLAKKVHINANTEEAYSFNLKSNLKDVNLIEVMGLLLNGGKGMMEVKGDIVAGKFFFKKRFPVNVSERIKLNN
jgi:LEA14-like dessication related protein